MTAIQWQRKQASPKEDSPGDIETDAGNVGTESEGDTENDCKGL